MDASQLIARKQAKQLQMQKEAQKKLMVSGKAQPNTYNYPDSSSLISAIQGSPLILQETNKLIEKKIKYEEELKKENENTILVLLLGDGRVSVLETAIREAHKKSPYSSKQLRTTHMILTELYAGANLQNYDVVVLYTKNNLMFEMNVTMNFNNIFEEGCLEYHPEFGKSLNTYMSNGGNLVMASFCWGEDDAIPSFDYNVFSPFQYGGLSKYLDSYRVNPSIHPIFGEIKDPFTIQITDTPLNIEKVLTTVKLTRDSKCIAKISDTIPFIAVKEIKKARTVAINSYVSFPYSGLQSKPILIDIVYNSILWCKRIMG
jgi:hypothetical protein